MSPSPPLAHLSEGCSSPAKGRAPAVSPALCHMEETLHGAQSLLGAGGAQNLGEARASTSLRQALRSSPRGFGTQPVTLGTMCWPGGVWKMVSESQAGSLGGREVSLQQGPEGIPGQAHRRGVLAGPHTAPHLLLCALSVVRSTGENPRSSLLGSGTAAPMCNSVPPGPSGPPAARAGLEANHT